MAHGYVALGSLGSSADFDRREQLWWIGIDCDAPEYQHRLVGDTFSGKDADVAASFQRRMGLADHRCHHDGQKLMCSRCLLVHYRIQKAVGFDALAPLSPQPPAMLLHGRPWEMASPRPPLQIAAWHVQFPLVPSSGRILPSTDSFPVVVSFERSCLLSFQALSCSGRTISTDFGLRSSFSDSAFPMCSLWHNSPQVQHVHLARLEKKMWEGLVGRVRMYSKVAVFPLILTTLTHGRHEVYSNAAELGG
mmetsp:Transcript_10090/g.22134  ORF Transcript_10090/g.22134 Transcript_10090/m.22134 type:complete len:249 (-) Transcript_10090:2149-2895(-)